MSIIIVSGLPGSGKSYFASKLSERLDAEYISSDRLRKKMFSARKYSENEKEKVYNEMYKQSKEAISRNKTIVLDATFYKSKLREPFNELAKNRVLKFIVIEITAPESLLKKRLSAKRMESEADWNVYEKLKNMFEPITLPHLTLISGEDNIEEMISTGLDYINGKK